MSNNLARLFASFFCIGFIPVAPGTCASLVGFFLYRSFYSAVTTYALIFIVVLVLGFFTSGIAEQTAEKKDPSFVVIDEVTGAMIAFFMLPLTAPVMMTAFFIFRAFDMFKIYPINRLEDLKGGAGIMMDDIVAGIYTNLVMHAAFYLKNFIS